MTRPHVPQIPSRQSLSNAIGSSPSRVSRSFNTSSISRNDISGEISSSWYETIWPFASEFFWRHTRNVIFTYNSAASSRRSRIRGLPYGGLACHPHHPNPTRPHRRNSHRHAVPHGLLFGSQTGSGRRKTRCGGGHRCTSIPPV